MNLRFFFWTGLVTLTSGLSAARADVTPNPLFADNAVLQQRMKVPVWGAATPGERVTVEFAGQTVSTTAAADGQWLVYLEPLKAGGPQTLTISGGNKIVLTNILVGEVWVCSGQSNMERQLGLRAGQQPIVDWEQEAAAANYPEIRQFGAAQTKAFAPAQTVKGDWAVCSPTTVTNFTAVGYFFGRDLYPGAACAHRVDSQFVGWHAVGGVDERSGFAHTSGFCGTAGGNQTPGRRSGPGTAGNPGPAG